MVRAFNAWLWVHLAIDNITLGLDLLHSRNLLVKRGYLLIYNYAMTIISGKTTILRINMTKIIVLILSFQ